MTVPRARPKAGPGPKTSTGVRVGPGMHNSVTIAVTAETRNAIDGTVDDLVRPDDLVLDDPLVEEDPDFPNGDLEDPATAAEEGEWVGEISPGQRAGIRVEIAFSVGASGQIEAEVLALSGSGDPLRDRGRVERHERLLRTAAALIKVQPAAIRAASLDEAYLALVPILQEQLATHVDPVSKASSSQGPSVSRERRVYVSMPSGVVPLEFFHWRKEGDDARTEAVVVYLWNGGYRNGNPVPSKLELRTRIADQVGLTVDTVSRHERVLRDLRDRWFVIEDHQSRWPEVDDEEARRDLGSAQTRSETAVRLALIGVLAPPPDLVPEGASGQEAFFVPPYLLPLAGGTTWSAS